MANVSGRKVKSFRMHQSTQVLGIGMVGDKLVDKNIGRKSTSSDLEMVLFENGVLCSTKGKAKDTGKTVEFFIFGTNIISVELESEANS